MASQQEPDPGSGKEYLNRIYSLPKTQQSVSSSPSIIQRIWNKMAPALSLLAASLLAFRVVSGKNDDHRRAVQPNFVFIMTDDQDLHLNSLDYQQIVQNQLIQKGTIFKKHYCTISICCPSRVSLLTGKAAHNTNVTDVKAPHGGYPKFISQGLNDAYLPVWLQSAGYNTYYTGKLMNQHNTHTYKAPFAKGWTRSDFLLDPGTYRYFDGIMSLDYQVPRSIKGLYSTDVVANRSLEFLEDAITAGKPFFLGVAPVGPHANTDEKGFTNPIPADRHKLLFPDVRAPRTPNFNPSTPGHVNYLKNLPQFTPEQLQYSDHFYRARLQALQSVDELVGGLIARLEESPEVLANTYIIYTSDNGYHIGQHRMPPGKTCNIEEDVNVPFIVRGPGVAPGREVTFPTSHTDIVPTVFKLAGIPLHEDFDGVPIAVTSAAQETQTRKSEHVNIEFWGNGIVEGEAFRALIGKLTKNTYKTIRVVAGNYDFMYAVWCTNEHQLYDMKTDPYQMTNLYGLQGNTSGYDIAKLSSRLDTLLLTLKSCKGKVCREPWQTLFPTGGVTNLADAMNTAYDDFFLTQQHKITFTECGLGYIPEYEGALEPIIYDDGTGFVSRNNWEDWV
ncbi:arylsulfatase [Pochonia chlamydosporia 170]|uniref:Arylsulfatase n=1 Tax=Pochonia chlamydosporia 170 TaxID=1380566 RepID=A0A179F5I4_METCM|nr:arylsulfatase [Pochonia chlamydosporia 170]OAQ60601.1 arylsulfatase [Pochonia chlamydosporia 170]